MQHVFLILQENQAAPAPPSYTQNDEGLLEYGSVKSWEVLVVTLPTILPKSITKFLKKNFVRSKEKQELQLLNEVG
jgi:hypothetical protein